MGNDFFADHISKGISLMSVEKYEKAKTEFEAAIEIDKKSYDAYIHLGNACANLGEFDEAIMAFNNALMIDSSSGEALYSIGNIHMLKEEKLKAVEYYNKAENAGYKKADLYQMLAMIFYESNDTPQALRNITRAIDAEPLDGNLRLFKARVYLAENKYDEALETLDDMQKILPDAFEAYDLRAQIFSALGEYEKALLAVNDGVNRFPSDANLAISKLKVLIEMKNDDEANRFISEMKKAGLYDKVLKQSVIQESILILRKKDTDGTIKLLNEANSKLSTDIDITYLLLDVYGKLEKYEKVLELSNDLVKLQPGMYYEVTAKYFYAHALKKLGRSEEAKTEFKKLTSFLRNTTIANPSFYEGYIFRLLSHTQLGEYDKALDLADYIENLRPNSTDSHSFRYFIYKEQGDMEKAEIEKKAAIQMNPGIIL